MAFAVQKTRCKFTQTFDFVVQKYMNIGYKTSRYLQQHLVVKPFRSVNFFTPASPLPKLFSANTYEKARMFSIAFNNILKYFKAFEQIVLLKSVDNMTMLKLPRNRPRSIYQYSKWLRGFQLKLLYLVLFSLYLIPRSHQSVNMFKSCLVKHCLKLFSV